MNREVVTRVLEVREQRAEKALVEVLEKRSELRARENELVRQEDRIAALQAQRAQATRRFARRILRSFRIAFYAEERQSLHHLGFIEEQYDAHAGELRAGVRQAEGHLAEASAMFAQASRNAEKLREVLRGVRKLAARRNETLEEAESEEPVCHRATGTGPMRVERRCE